MGSNKHFLVEVKFKVEGEEGEEKPSEHYIE